MTLVLEIGSDLEKRIREAAPEVGVSPDKYVLEIVTKQLAGHEQHDVKILSATEASLLQKINESLSQFEWGQYHTLIAKRQAEQLTSKEQTELILLSDQLEQANVKRIQYASKLADIRGVALPTVMKEFGLKPISHD
ncbi:MAG: hypothetical protein AAF614_14975 [Chloroflexota bacterium]